LALTITQTDVLLSLNKTTGELVGRFGHLPFFIWPPRKKNISKQ